MTAISFTGQEVEGMQEDVEYKHFVTQNPVEVQLGETAGHSVTVTSSHFVVASIEGENTDEVAVAMGAPKEFDEASVFISNEEGELGAGLFRIDEAGIDDALDRFEKEYL